MTRIKNNNFQKKKKITNQKLLLILSNFSCFRTSFKSDHFQKIHESSSIRSLCNIFQLYPKFPSYLIKFRNLEIEIFKFFLQLITVRDISSPPPRFTRKSSIIPRKGWNPVLINPVANPPRGHPPENYNFRSHSYQKKNHVHGRSKELSLSQRYYIRAGSGETLDVPLTEALSASKAGGLLGILIWPQSMPSNIDRLD